MKILKPVSLVLLSLLLILLLFVGYSSIRTEQDIERFQQRVAQLGQAVAVVTADERQLASLPAPVQRYFAFVFKDAVKPYSAVRLQAAGQFRRPQTEGFNATTAEQVIAATTPALMFSATTPVVPGIWARAYDFFAEGKMEMKAKILSALTVVDERETPTLNQISLRRWLLESPLFPQALLPGGSVSWEAIDDTSARATVNADGLSASMRVVFDAAGRIVAMQAEEDGDLTTPYHGSGEHVTRTDYREVDGQMIPFGFTISRAAGGQLYPFWEGVINNIAFTGVTAQ